MIKNALLFECEIYRFWHPFWGPTWPPKVGAPSTFFDVFSKMPPRRPKMRPRAPQEAPKVAQERPKVLQECPKTRQERPKSLPRGPNHAPKSEKTENPVEKLPLWAITQKSQAKNTCLIKRFVVRGEFSSAGVGEGKH